MTFKQNKSCWGKHKNLFISKGTLVFLSWFLYVEISIRVAPLICLCPDFSLFSEKLYRYFLRIWWSRECYQVTCPRCMIPEYSIASQPFINSIIRGNNIQTYLFPYLLNTISTYNLSSLQSTSIYLSVVSRSTLTHMLKM